MFFTSELKVQRVTSREGPVKAERDDMFVTGFLRRAKTKTSQKDESDSGQSTHKSLTNLVVKQGQIKLRI